jgi:hypothetical protein
MTNRARATRQDRASRNRGLEAGYHLERAAGDERLSVLAIVTRDQDELAKEFLGTLQGDLFGTPSERDKEALLLGWEERRFGRQLEPAAHGILRGAVRRADEEERKRRARETSGPPTGDSR